MRQVILQIDITLDGFVGGLDGGQEWVKAGDDMNQEAYALLGQVDTIILGRVAYQMFSSYWPFADTTAANIGSQIAQRLNQADKVVFSRTLGEVEWGRWNNARLAKAEPAEEILAMKAQPGKDILLYAGAKIVSAFIGLGLIDQFQLRVHPVILGSGKRIFTNTPEQMELDLANTKAYQNGVVLLDYRPAR